MTQGLELYHKCQMYTDILKGQPSALVMRWRHQMEHFPRYWPLVRGIHRSPGQYRKYTRNSFSIPWNIVCRNIRWRCATVFEILLCAWISKPKQLDNREQTCEFARFEFRMSFGHISYISMAPQASKRCEIWTNADCIKSKHNWGNRNLNPRRTHVHGLNSLRDKFFSRNRNAHLHT